MLIGGTMSAEEIILAELAAWGRNEYFTPVKVS
jgi:hypothetical protein